MKRNSDMCKRLVFANIALVHVILAIALYQSLWGGIRLARWVGCALVVLAIVFDVLAGMNAVCKHCGAPLKRSNGYCNPQWDLYKAIFSGKLTCPRCGKKL